MFGVEVFSFYTLGKGCLVPPELLLYTIRNSITVVMRWHIMECLGKLCMRTSRVCADDAREIPST